LSYILRIQSPLNNDGLITQEINKRQERVMSRINNVTFGTTAVFLFTILSKLIDNFLTYGRHSLRQIPSNSNCRDKDIVPVKILVTRCTSPPTRPTREQFWIAGNVFRNLVLDGPFLADFDELRNVLFVYPTLGFWHRARDDFIWRRWPQFELRFK